MYTVKKIEDPQRGTLFTVGAGDSIVNRFTDEAEAKENCTALNGGEVAEKKLAEAEKKAEEAAKKVETDRAAAAKAKPAAKADDNHKPRAHAAKAKTVYVKRMAPKSKTKSRRK